VCVCVCVCVCVLAREGRERLCFRFFKGKRFRCCKGKYLFIFYCAFVFVRGSICLSVYFFVYLFI